jgi:hypothetical protein
LYFGNLFAFDAYVMENLQVGVYSIT